MKKRLLLLAFTLTVFTSFSQDWKRFKSEEFNFIVDFPAVPEESVQKVPTAVGELDMNMFMLTRETGDNVVYSVISSSYPKEQFINATESYNNSVLDGAVNGAVKNVNGKLVFDNKVVFNGYPGRSFKISYQGAFLYINAYLVENTMMICQVICYEAKDGNEGIKKFFDSFDIIKTKS